MHLLRILGSGFRRNDVYLDVPRRSSSRRKPGSRRVIQPSAFTGVAPSSTTTYLKNPLSPGLTNAHIFALDFVGLNKEGGCTFGSVMLTCDSTFIDDSNSWREREASTTGRWLNSAQPSLAMRVAERGWWSWRVNSPNGRRRRCRRRWRMVLRSKRPIASLTMPPLQDRADAA